MEPGRSQEGGTAHGGAGMNGGTGELLISAAVKIAATVVITVSVDLPPVAIPSRLISATRIINAVVEIGWTDKTLRERIECLKMASSPMPPVPHGVNAGWDEEQEGGRQTEEEWGGSHESSRGVMVWKNSSMNYNTRRNATRSPFSSALRFVSRMRLKNSTVSSRVNKRPSWR